MMSLVGEAGADEYQFFSRDRGRGGGGSRGARGKKEWKPPLGLGSRVPAAAWSPIG